MVTDVIYSTFQRMLKSEFIWVTETLIWIIKSKLTAKHNIILAKGKKKERKKTKERKGEISKGKALPAQRHVGISVWDGAHQLTDP